MPPFPRTTTTPITSDKESKPQTFRLHPCVQSSPALALVVSLSSLGLLSNSKKQFKFYNSQISTRLAQLVKQDNIFLILWTNSKAGQRTILNMIAYTLHYDHFVPYSKILCLLNGHLSTEMKDVFPEYRTDLQYHKIKTPSSLKQLETRTWFPRGYDSHIVAPCVLGIRPIL